MSEPYEPHVRVVRWWLLAIFGSLASVVIPGLAIWAATSLWPILFWCCCGGGATCNYCSGTVPMQVQLTMAGWGSAFPFCSDCDYWNNSFVLDYNGTACFYGWQSGTFTCNGTLGAGAFTLTANFHALIGGNYYVAASSNASTGPPNGAITWAYAPASYPIDCTDTYSLTYITGGGGTICDGGSVTGTLVAL